MKVRTLLSLVAVASTTFGAPASADGPARKSRLSDFLGAQGSQSIYVPPAPPDYWGWTAPPPGVKTPAPNHVGGNSGSCDYAGLANKWLVANGAPNPGTSFAGSITERLHGDGRILARVELRTKNAPSFGLRFTAPDYGNIATDPLNFGARAQDLLAGATPGIGECHVPFAWLQDPGALIDFNRTEGDARPCVGAADRGARLRARRNAGQSDHLADRHLRYRLQGRDRRRLPCRVRRDPGHRQVTARLATRQEIVNHGKLQSVPDPRNEHLIGKFTIPCVTGARWPHRP